jgi:hypothetical protein
VNTSLLDPACCNGADTYPLVLLADHERLYRWFASQCLEAAGRRLVCFAEVSEMLAFLDRTSEDVMILVDEQTMRDGHFDPVDILQHGRSVTRIYVLADAPDEVRLGEFGDAVVAKPCDRDRLVALVS